MTRLNHGLVIACWMIVIGSFLVELLYLSSVPDFVGGNLYPGMCFLPTSVLSLPLFAIWALSSFQTAANRSPELESNGEDWVLGEWKGFLWAFIGRMTGFYLANLLHLILSIWSDGYTALWGMSGGYTVLFIVTGATLMGVVIKAANFRTESQKIAKVSQAGRAILPMEM